MPEESAVGPATTPRPAPVTGLRARLLVGRPDQPDPSESENPSGPADRDRAQQTPRRADGGVRDQLRVLGAGLLAVLLVVIGAWMLVDRWRHEELASITAKTVAAVDPATIKGSATSVQKPDGGITYGVGNTLDGNPSTAWNSDGARDGRGPGITVTYRFAEPVNLRSITIRNGYQKVRPNDGVDLWTLNERIRQIQVVTDGGQWIWNLQDARKPQTLSQNFGRTTVVRLKIAQVYPSSKYRDVAISEIGFTAMS
jgi:hypothetical protein